MKKIYSFILIVFICFSHSSYSAQIWADTINVNNIYLDTTTTVLGQITLNIATPGKIEVHFDGECEGDTNDMTVLAASNYPDWDSNDGNVGVYTQNLFATGRSFSHSRFYTVTPGQYTYYAVGQNYVCQGGSGYASIFGMLTVIFYPDSEMNILSGKVFGNTYDLNNGLIYLDSITINPQVAGKAVVRFDGTCGMDEGDRVYIGVNNDSTFTGIQPIFLETNSASVCFDDIPFATSNVFTINPGPNTFYPMAANYSETDGNGSAWISGTFTVSFYPDGGGNVVEYSSVNSQAINLGNGVADIASVNLNAPAGFLYLHADGICVSDSGDWNSLAVNDSINWFPDFGNVRTSAYDNDVNESTFSHTLVYQTPLATNDYHLVGQNTGQTGGSGMADVIGTLIAISFPNINTGISSIDDNDVSCLVYPNPSSGSTMIKINLQEKQKISVGLYDINGKLIRSIADEIFQIGNHKFQLNTSDLQSEIYFIRILRNDKLTIRKLVVK